MRFLRYPDRDYDFAHEYCDFGSKSTIDEQYFANLHGHNTCLGVYDDSGFRIYNDCHNHG
jgi:hypothetical protein